MSEISARKSVVPGNNIYFTSSRATKYVTSPHETSLPSLFQSLTLEYAKIVSSDLCHLSKVDVPVCSRRTFQFLNELLRIHQEAEMDSDQTSLLSAQTARSKATVFVDMRSDGVRISYQPGRSYCPR